MNQALLYLGTHWLAATLLVAGLMLSALFMHLGRTTRSFVLLLTGAPLALLALGALLVPEDWAVWLAIGAGAVLFGMVLTVVTTGRWYAPLGYSIGGLLLLGFGGLWVDPLGEVISEAFHTIRGLEALQPWWLLLLLVIPLIFYFSFHSLAG